MYGLTAPRNNGRSRSVRDGIVTIANAARLAIEGLALTVLEEATEQAGGLIVHWNGLFATYGRIAPAEPGWRPRIYRIIDCRGDMVSWKFVQLKQI